METMSIKSTEDWRDLKNIQSEKKLFGWELKSNEKVNEMVGVNQFQEYSKYTFERDETMPNYEQIVTFEKQYADLKEMLARLNQELEYKKQLDIGEEPVWVKTKTTNLGTINGQSNYTYTKTTYYNNYVPMNWIFVVALFSPLLPFSLAYIIVKSVKKSKAKKLLKKDHAEYEKKLADKKNQISQAKKAISDAEKEMENIISTLNAL